MNIFILDKRVVLIQKEFLISQVLSLFSMKLEKL